MQLMLCDADDMHVFVTYRLQHFVAIPLSFLRSHSCTTNGTVGDCKQISFRLFQNNNKIELHSNRGVSNEARVEFQIKDCLRLS